MVVYPGDDGDPFEIDDAGNVVLQTRVFRVTT
jgi:hypothetical protein